MKQYEQVLKIMKKNGGYATLGFLNQKMDTSNWKTKTPFASIRSIVQDEKLFFKIRPGLYGIEEMKKKIFKIFEIQEISQKKEDSLFNHSYFQGLIVEIGNLTGYTTYIPRQDQNKKFLEKPLGALTSIQEIFKFTYPETIGRSKNIDVIWFNRRKMPNSFFEIEHSTDIQNSLLKFCDLQDFHSNFYIVASSTKKKEFEKKLKYDAFSNIQNRVQFMNYDDVAQLHSLESKKFALSTTKI